MKKALIAFLLQLPLIVLTKDVALGETSNRDNITNLELTSAANARQAESTTLSSLNETSTISGADKNSMNETLKAETTTPEAPTSTTSLEQLLIPPATVEAQIVNANISTRKPSRLQVVAA